MATENVCIGLKFSLTRLELITHFEKKKLWSTNSLTLTKQTPVLS